MPPNFGGWISLTFEYGYTKNQLVGLASAKTLAEEKYIFALMFPSVVINTGNIKDLGEH